MSFPQRHPLCGPGANTSYDFTLGLEQPGTVGLVGPSLATLLSRDSTNIGFGGIAPGVSRARWGGVADAAAARRDVRSTSTLKPACRRSSTKCAGR
jgi:hypothetical protein